MGSQDKMSDRPVRPSVHELGVLVRAPTWGMAATVRQVEKANGGRCRPGNCQTGGVIRWSGSHTY